MAQQTATAKLCIAILPTKPCVLSKLDVQPRQAPQVSVVLGIVSPGVHLFCTSGLIWPGF